MVDRRSEGDMPITFADIPVENVKVMVGLCSGRSIIPQAVFDAIGVPTDLISPYVREHKSSFRSPSSTIFVNGEPVESVTGVYGLELMRKICDDLGVSTETKFMGRGWQERELVERLEKHLDEKLIPQAFQDIPPIS